MTTNVRTLKATIRNRKVKRRRELFLEQCEERTMLATVTTDLLDYQPGATAYITADGFQLGEAITFHVLHNDGTPNTGNGHLPWTVVDGSTADGDHTVNGTVLTSWYVDPDDSYKSSFDLTASGPVTGTVSTTFSTCPNTTP